LVAAMVSRLGVSQPFPYVLLALGLWLATLFSGVHATIAGVAMGVLATAHPPFRSDLEEAGSVWRLFREEPTPEYARNASRTLARTISPNERVQHLFHPWTSMVVVPLFALANAGVHIDGEVLRRSLTSAITLGIVAGLVIGKLVGITGMTWLVTRRRLGAFPMTVPWPQLVGVSAVAGIGFTVSLLIAGITFEGPDLEEAKIGILAASIVGSLVAWLVFAIVNRMSPQRQQAGAENLAPPIRDLAELVDPEVDHIRGRFDAPVTLVEYGDFECPYCGRAEPVVEELVAAFGDDLAFVFRHLPLGDVHEHAELAAEAAEAAGAQGRFWEMHDALFSAEASLSEPGLMGHAAALGLDLDRFVTDLRERRHALRVARDIASADESGAPGTPTFFINGGRYAGRFDVSAMSAAIRREMTVSPPEDRP
ncbi:MAG: Na+/H+ antiporter NhaA, partial [Acidimicrobiia bacterium]